LPICKDDDGLATVLGHEIAHNVAHHSGENLSRYAIILPILVLGSLFFDVSGQLLYTVMDFAYSRPGSRKQEVCCVTARLSRHANATGRLRQTSLG
jgi:Zn-dependent protease with chaperone function